MYLSLKKSVRRKIKGLKSKKGICREKQECEKNDGAIKLPDMKKSVHLSFPLGKRSIVKKNAQINDDDGEEKVVKKSAEPQVPIKECPFTLHPRLLKELEVNGFVSFTRVQSLALPAILKSEERNVMIRSQTGTGKTLAYLIPLIQKLQAIEPPIKRSQGPFLIVLLPTKELALQTFDIAQRLLKAFVRIVATCFIGGMNRKHEKDRIRKGVNILFGTPGRIEDHVQNTATLDFSQVKYLVLDEADRMLDMGFKNSIASIVKSLKNKKKFNESDFRIVLTSATLTKQVVELSDLYINDPIFIDTTSESMAVLPVGLKHAYVLVPYAQRLTYLIEFVREQKEAKVLVFVSTNDSVRFHHEFFSVLFEHENGDGPRFFKLYGDLCLDERRAMYKSFSKVKGAAFLFSTDVAARGLDFANVTWIVQYNCPCSLDEYIHRVGRTARFHSTGNALFFVDPCERDSIKMIEEHCRLRMDEQVVTQRQQQINNLEQLVNNTPSLRELAVAAYVSFVRSYATLKRHEWKNVFNHRKLHLGHVAKSFALTDPPTQIAQQFLYNRKREPTNNNNITSNINQIYATKVDLNYEFQAGF